MQSASTAYDVVVIGGGINGAGIARDAALRGMRVLLLEQDDFGSGTSSWSSRLIHGGLRYLEYGEIPLVFESLHERARLRKNAAHLVKRLRINIPVYRNSKRGMLLIRLGMIAYDLLSFGKSSPGHRMQSRDELLREEPGLCAEGLLGGAQYYDAQVTFAERLVLENVIAANESGADVRNHCPVVGIEVRDGAVESLRFVDPQTGGEVAVAAKVIINAAGPWVDRVLATVNRDMPRFMGGTKGSHIIVGPFGGAPHSAFYVEAQKDGRPFFIIPWNGQYLIGTTDIRFDGDPGDVVASEAEVRYLLDETNRVFPAAKLTRSDIHFTYAGVRPLPRQEHGPESAITRKHIIKRHRHEARGLLSIIGGKLTTYRSLAEQAVDKVARAGERRFSACETRDSPLPGCQGLQAADEQLRRDNRLNPQCIERLLSIYGSRATLLLDIAEQQSSIAFLDEAKCVLQAEVRHAIRHEFATTLVDIVHRRMMVGLAPDLGAPISGRVASLAATELAWDSAETARQLALLQRHNESLRPAAVFG